MGYKIYAGTLDGKVGGDTYWWHSRQVIYSCEGDSIQGHGNLPVVEDPELNLAANEPGTLTFSIPYKSVGLDGEVHTNPLYNGLATRKSMVSVEEDGEEIFIGYVKAIDLNFDLSQKITVNGILGLLDEIEDFVEPQTWKLSWKNHSDSSTDNIFEDFLDRTIGLPLYDNTINIPARLDASGCNVDMASTIDTTEDGGQVMTFWGIVQKYLLDEYGGYFSITTEKAGTNAYRFVFHYTSDGIGTTKQTIEYGKNLLDLTITEDTDDIVNYIMVSGTETKSKGWWIFKKKWTERVYGVAYDEDSVERYGPIVRCIYSNDDTTENACQKAADEELTKHDHFTVPELTVRSFDQVDAGVQTDRLRFMKRTKIVSSPHKVEGWYLCTKEMLPLAHLDEKEFTYGVPPVKLTKQQNQLKASQDAALRATRGIISHLNS